jgi:hypothetical protein
MMRNYLINQKPTGDRFRGYLGLAENILVTVKYVLSWIAPVKELIPLYLISLFILIFILARKSRILMEIQGKSELRVVNFGVLFGFAVLYYVVFLYSATITNLDPNYNRYLAPIYFPAWYVLIEMCREAYSLLKNGAGKRITKYAMASMLLFLMIMSVNTTIGHLKKYFNDGAGGYSSAAWKQSETIQRTKGMSLDGELYSNDPYVLYLVSGLRCKLAPRKFAYISPDQIKQDIIELEAIVNKGISTYLIWFGRSGKKHGLRHWYYPDELEEWFQLRKIAMFEDGELFEIKKRTK